MDALGIADGSVVADMGAGGGWFTVRLARRVGPSGRVYAEDIQRQMIESIERRVKREGFAGRVKTVLGSPLDPKLPDGALDAALFVDAYHEVEHPVALLRNLATSLKPDGRIGIVDFTSEGGGPGPADERARRSGAGDPQRRGRRPAAAVARRSSPLSIHAGLRAGECAGGQRAAMIAVPEFFRDYQQRVDQELRRLVPLEGSRVQQSMAYTVHAPSKRVRAVLTLLCAELCGGSAARAVPAAAAIELVHASSLILDDLPAMDDAPLRRGRASNHVAFGEAIAILAAFGLLNLAYGELSRAYDASAVGCAVRVAQRGGRAGWA